MAVEKEKKSRVTHKSILDRLTPNAITIVVNGDEVRVPADVGENHFLNMLLASRLRTLIERTMDRYKADEIALTPKELRDLTAAGRDVATFSGEVYQAAEPMRKEPVPAEPAMNEISFDSLHTPPEVQKRKDA